MFSVVLGLLIGFSRISGIRVKADGEPVNETIIPAEILGFMQANHDCICRAKDRWTGLQTLYDVGTFQYLGMRPSSDIIDYESDYVYDYRNMSGGYYLLYRYELPYDFQLASSDVVSFAVDFDTSFSNMNYVQWTMGISYNSSGSSNPMQSSFPANYTICSGDSPFNGHVSAVTRGDNPQYQTLCDFGCMIPTMQGYTTDRAYFIENTLHYSGETQISFDVAGLVADGCEPVQGDCFYLAVFGPVVSQDYEVEETPQTLDKILETADESKDLLNDIKNGISGLNTLLTSGLLLDIDLTLHRIEGYIAAFDFTGSGSGSGSSCNCVTESALLRLFVPTDEQFTTKTEQFSELLEESFPLAFDARDMVSDTVDGIKDATIEPQSTIHIPSLTVQGTEFIPAQDVNLKPAGFDVLYDSIALVVDIVCTFAFVNAVRKRFEHGVLENQG